MNQQTTETHRTDGWRRILEWDAASKCLAISVLSLTVAAGYGVFGRSVVGRTTLHSWFDPRVMALGLRALGPVSAVWVTLTATSWWLRRRRRNPAWLPHVIVQAYVVGNGLLAYGIGPVTNPVVAVVLVGGAVVNLVLFDWPVAIGGVFTAAVLLVVATIATSAGALPYAPLLGPRLVAAAPTPAAAALWGGVSLILAFALVGMFGYLFAQIHRYERILEELSTTDALTGLANRGALMAQVGEEFRRALRYKTPLSLVLIDVDRFKPVNDEHGHLCGDRTLVAVAQAIADCTRSSDTAGRYGGDEFAVVLPETDIGGAHAFAERCRAKIAAVGVNGDAAAALRVTASFGCAGMLHDGENHHEDLLRRADEALYRAKAAGRNRVELWAPAAVGRE